MNIPDPTQKIPGCPHFTWQEALWLPQWSRIASQEDGLNEEILESLKTTFKALESLRTFFGKPIKVHVAYRPDAYNRLVKGAKGSAHTKGMAVDFSIPGIACDEVREKIIQNKLLEALGVRMEDLPGSNWLHIDTRSPGPSGRFFKP